MSVDEKIENAKEHSPSWALLRADGTVDTSTVLCDEHSGGAEKVAAIRNAHGDTNTATWVRVPKAKHSCIICIYDNTGKTPSDEGLINLATGEVLEDQHTGNPWDVNAEDDDPMVGGFEFWNLSDDDTLEVRAWLQEFLKSRGKVFPGGEDKQGGALAALAWRVGLKIEDAVNGINTFGGGHNPNHPTGFGQGGWHDKDFGGYSGYGGHGSYEPRNTDARDTAFREFRFGQEVPDEISLDDEEEGSNTPIEVIIRDHEAGEHDTPDPECPMCNGQALIEETLETDE